MKNIKINKNIKIICHIFKNACRNHVLNLDIVKCVIGDDCLDSDTIEQVFTTKYEKDGDPECTVIHSFSDVFSDFSDVL